MVSLLKEACDAEAWCSLQGLCRSDGSCVCNPEFYGVNCTKEIVSGEGVTDIGLAFVIIFGLVVLPCLALGLFYWYSQHHDAIYEKIRFRTSAERRAQLGLEEHKRESARRASAQVSPSVTSPSTTEDTDVEMQRLPSNQEEGKGGDDPKTRPQLTAVQEKMLAQVKEILGDKATSDDELVAKLQASGWNINSLMTRMLSE